MTIIINGHENYNESKLNKEMLKKIKVNKNTKLFNLDDIDLEDKNVIELQRKELEKADKVIFIGPVYWYSWTSLTAKWFENVFISGWGFASNNENDKYYYKNENGKITFHGVGGFENTEVEVWLTAGGPLDSYKKGGYNNNEMPKYLFNLVQNFTLAKAKYNKLSIYHMTSDNWYSINPENLDLKDVEIKNKFSNFVKEFTKSF